MGERFRPYNEADYGPLRTIEKENGPEYPPLIEGRPTVSVDLHNIEWKNGDKMMVRELDKPADLVEPLLYRDEKTTTVSAYEVYFQEKGKHPVCLNKLLSPEHNIVIIGANSFWAFDTEMKSGPNRTTIIALDPMQLYREITMAAAFHELGHANLYEGMDDYVFDLFVSGG